MSIINHQNEQLSLLKKKSRKFREEGYPYKNRFVLLMASYCGDNPECSDYRPCLDCLQMSNIGILEGGEITDICGYDYIKNTKLKTIMKRPEETNYPHSKVKFEAR